MFKIDVRRIYGDYSYFRLHLFTTVLSLTGFEAFTYTASLPQSANHTYPYNVIPKPQPFSIVLLLTASNGLELLQRIRTVQEAFYQYGAPDIYRQIVILNTQTNSIFETPVVVENVSVTKQIGLSAEITITGFRVTQGLGSSPYPSPITVTTSTSGLPKTLSLNYPASYHSPLIITLTGPISAGFSISRSEGYPDFDFTLTVGTSIPSGVSVSINYGDAIINGLPPVTNVGYLSNPEICPDLVIRPKSVNGNETNVFQLSGPSSSGSVTIGANFMSWSIYE